MNFKYEIGTLFCDKKRDMEIIDRVVKTGYRKDRPNERVKIYTCKCNRCGDNSFEITEYHLNENRGCPTCHGKKVTPGINDIYTTDNWMVKFFVNEPDSKKYTANSISCIDMKCPYCGNVFNYKIANLHKLKHLSCSCSDGVSYPEKFMTCLLDQCKEKYVYQFTSKNEKWCNKYMYDFFIPIDRIIIETNGEQHYHHKSGFFSDISKIKRNDNIKMELAIKNGINKYFSIDCSVSDKDYIRNSIEKTDLLNYINKQSIEIDWEKCNDFACKNIIKEVCEYKNMNPFLSSNDISKLFHVNRRTISSYLSKGRLYGWTIFGGCGKPIEVFQQNISLGKFSNVNDVVVFFNNVKKIDMNSDCIKRACRNECSQYKGYNFKYIGLT